MDIIDKLTKVNFTVGREGNSINKIIIHWIGEGTALGAISWFQNKNAKASAHYVVSEDKIYRCVKEEDTAWQAGDWETNLCSIGIEHDAIPDRPASELTYQTSAKLIKDICERYSIPIDRTYIIGHREVVPTQCCGTIDVDKLVKLAKEDSIELKDKIIDWYDAEGKQHNVGWYVYEWDVEKKKAKRLVEEVTSKDKDYERLQKTLSEQNLQVINLQKDVKSKSDEINRLSGIVEASENKLKEEVENYEKAATICIKIKDTLTKENSEFVGEITELKKEVERLKKLKNMDKNTLWEATKEPLRLLVLSVIPIGVIYFASLPYEWAAIAVVVLRFVDKILHEIGKKTENELLKLGLTRF